MRTAQFITAGQSRSESDHDNVLIHPDKPLK
jgi:hypothetical protein